MHVTPIEHWLSVGKLRSTLRVSGLTVSTPDAHVAQCSLELGARLLTEDKVFEKIARVTHRLRLAERP